MAYTRKLLPDLLRSIDSATFVGTYLALGTPLTYNCSIVKLVNNSTVLVTVSIDGVNDYDVAPGNSFYLYDVTSDSPQESGSIFISKGTQYYVKGSVGSGLVYLVTYYVAQSPVPQLATD
jgi:hypothetical protein